MNSGLHSVDLQRAAQERPEGRSQVEAWRRLLAACGRKAGRRRVHELRVATLRLQAQLEHGLGALEAEAPAARAARRWNKQAGKLRRVLGPVRDADVYLGKLAGLHESAAGPGGARLHSSRILLRQIDALERRFARQRECAAKELMAEIADRRERLEQTSREMGAALAPQAPRMGGAGASAVRELLAGLAAEFPELSGDNLHEFRMRIKKVRYLAEIYAAADPQAGRQAAALRKMQVAAGTWHDWQTLAKKAGHLFRGREKEGGLAELLETLEEESLEKALGVCQRTMARLQKESAGDEASPQLLPQKIPAQGVESIAVAERRRYA